MKSISLAIISLFSVSCFGTIDRADFSFEVHGSPEITETIKTAVEAWNETCSTNLSVVSEQGNIIITETDFPVLPESFYSGCPCEGITHQHNGVPSKITFEKSPSLTTVEHELGHILGLNHLPQGVMINPVHYDQRVSPYECQILRELNATEKTGFRAP